MNKKIRNYITAATVSFFLVIGCLFGILVYLFLTEDGKLPSDEQMIKHYKQYKTEFHELIQAVIVEDEVNIVYPGEDGHCQIDDPSSTEAEKRCEEYLRLFELLGFEWAYTKGEPFYMSVYAEGLSVSAIRKGYIYTSDPAKLHGSVVANTHEACTCLPCYRKIDDNLYIYLDD